MTLMKLKHILLYFAAFAMLGACSEAGDEPDGPGEVPGGDDSEIVEDPKIELSQTELSFGMEGGTATVDVVSNITLSLERNLNPDADLPPSVIVSDEYVVSDFFASDGAPMEIDAAYEDNRLTISVPKSERRENQYGSVSLYDAAGEVRATVSVNLEGDPSIEVKLGKTGVAIVGSCFEKFATAVADLWYVESGYAGLVERNDVRCPLPPFDSWNGRTFKSAYQSVAANNQIIKVLASAGLESATPVFELLKAMAYTELVDKWGRVGIAENASVGVFDIQQESVESMLLYVDSRLDAIAPFLEDKRLPAVYTADEAFAISKDVWRVAKANVCLALGNTREAERYLAEVADCGRYSLSDGASGVILNIFYQDGSAVAYYNLSDALLLLAECRYRLGNVGSAEALVAAVAAATSVSVEGDFVSRVDALRRGLELPRYFAFQKRCGLGGYEPYQMLWPIPRGQLDTAPGWTQNPGYGS